MKFFCQGFKGVSMKKLDDYDLIKLSLEGDQDAYAELLMRYKNLVYSVILRMINNAEEANDLAQEVFIKVYRNLDKYQPEFKFSTWIIRITTNHVIDYRRKKKQDTVPIEEMVNEPVDSVTPEEDYIRRERQKALAKAIASLPDMYKIPIVLYHNQGLSYQEIADIIHEPLSKVKNRIFRGRKMLKDMLLKEKEGEKGELQ